MMQEEEPTEIKTEWHEDEDEDALRQYLFSQDMDDRPELIVEVPEWKRRVLIKALSGTERAAFYAWQRGQDTQDPLYSKRMQFYLVSNHCLHTKTQKPFLKFGDQTAFMSGHNGAVIEMLSYTVLQFCKLDGSTMEQAKKNLVPVKSIATTK